MLLCVICWVRGEGGKPVKSRPRRHLAFIIQPAQLARDTPVKSNSLPSINTIRMRPPTRSTRSIRPPPNANNARRSSRGATGPPHAVASHSEVTTTSPKPELKSRSKSKPKLQSIIIAATADADADIKVDPGTLPGSNAAPVIGCFPVFPPATFVFENQSQNNHDQSQSHPESESLPLLGPGVAGTIVLGLGKPPPRSRQRLSSDKLEALDASFRRNTHPSRKEKEAICKDLDM
jgi:hypothetical protein